MYSRSFCYPVMSELKCHLCDKIVHSDKILIGDTYYIYKCSTCSPNEGLERFERLPISWANLIQMVLYHLWIKGGKKQRYFRWREDICGTIEERWNDLIPSKQKTSTWFNSVSSALSSNDRIFASGAAIKGASGWWALHHWEPPATPRKLLVKQASDSIKFQGTSEEIILSSDGEDVNVVPRGNILRWDQNEQYEDLIVDESEESEEEAEDYDIEMLNNSDTNNNEIEVINQGPIVPSADLKQQLLERLLMMDSSLLHNAIKKAKAKKMNEIEIGSVSVSGGAKKKSKTDEAAITIDSTSSATFNAETFPIPSDCLSAIEDMTLALERRLKAFPVIRASPYENDLLKKCNRVDYENFKTVARLRRKLLVRRQRRKANLALFDLDNCMYLFLKSPESALLITSTVSDTETSSLTVKPPPPKQFSNTFDPQSIPYIVDPSRSLYVKLTGMAAIYGTCPYPVMSPFSGKVLPEFIAEESVTLNIPKLLLLNQIKSLSKGQDDDSDGCFIDFGSLLRPSEITANSPSPNNNLTIKYTNFRKEFKGQLNDLLSDSFWPGIDISEALEYPDYAIIAVVGLSVVGCAICNPDGYLSYLYVRPDFQGFNLSSKLLSLLLPLLITKKDITLHVSVGNTPAMLLYQQIGFKPEEFIVNFYDKYLDTNRDLSISNKNAFLMRLKR